MTGSYFDESGLWKTWQAPGSLECSTRSLSFASMRCAYTPAVRALMKVRVDPYRLLCKGSANALGISMQQNMAKTPPKKIQSCPPLPNTPSPRSRDHLIPSTPLRPPTPKTNRPQFPPATTPHAAHSHQRRTRRHQRPPQRIRRQTSRIQRRHYEMDSVEGEGEIRH